VPKTIPEERAEPRDIKSNARREARYLAATQGVSDARYVAKPTTTRRAIFMERRSAIICTVDLRGGYTKSDAVTIVCSL